MNSQNSTLFKAYATAQRLRTFMTTMLASTFVLAQVVPTYATIDNTAAATGTYNGSTNNYGASTKNVPVAPPAPALTITKTAGAPTTALGTDATHTDAGDTITYTYVVKNTGNVTMNGVAPTDPGPTFNGSAGTSSLGAFSPAAVTLAPGITQTFTAVYTLTQLDVLHAAGVASGVSNTAGASGNYGSGPTAYNIPNGSKSTATTAIPAFAQLAISKTFVLAKAGGNLVAGKAELGDTITYTYAVTNVGNVAMTGVTVKDMHGTPQVQVGTGALVPGITGETLISDGPLAPGTVSSDAGAADGTYDTLQPGAVVNFTWAHVVTQAEVDNG